MWRVFEIVRNNSESLKSLQLDALGVDYYEIKFYNTVSKNTEVLCIDCVIAGNYICKVNDKKREFELNHQVIEFISNRYKLNTVAYQHFLVVESLSFLGVVPLSHRLMAISEVSKAEQKALNLLDIDFRYLRDRSTNEWLGNYVYGEVLQEMSVNIFFSA